MTRAGLSSGEELLRELRAKAQFTRHKPEDFAAMRKAGRVAAETLDHITQSVRPGVTTATLDAVCHEFMVRRGAIAAPLHYMGFPKAICTSVNNVICHGIPDGTALADGDIVNIGVTVVVDGWHGDASRMYFVGTVAPKAAELCAVTYEAMMRDIAAALPGATLGDIGYAIQAYAERHGFAVVRDFCGHGIGRIFQGPPEILHYGQPGAGAALVEGMFFTVEPMLNAGKPDARLLGDGWTAVTRDRSLSAQFEHTIGVTADGCEIFTRSPAGLDRPPHAA
ncbi:MAG: type I methionyl aminopeptidase [Alphaproteobacteria bacterium]|nr:type I methionyl aminopeptidase [Alphaproteobacteria bacterium]